MVKCTRTGPKASGVEVDTGGVPGGGGGGAPDAETPATPSRRAPDTETPSRRTPDAATPLRTTGSGRRLPLCAAIAASEMLSPKYSRKLKAGSSSKAPIRCRKRTSSMAVARYACRYPCESARRWILSVTVLHCMHRRLRPRNFSKP